MTEASILKKLDETKHPDTIDVIHSKKIKTNRQLFRIKNEKMQTIYTKKGEPYCYIAAKIDFERKQEDIFRRSGGKFKTEEDVEIVDFKLEKYADPKRFKVVKHDPIIEKKLMDGVAINVQTGEHVTYIDIYTHHQIAVQRLFTHEQINKSIKDNSMETK